MSHNKHHHSDGHGLASVLDDLRKAAAHTGDEATAFLQKASRTVEDLIRRGRDQNQALSGQIGASLTAHPRMAVGASLVALAGLVGLAALVHKRD